MVRLLWLKHNEHNVSLPLVQGLGRHICQFQCVGGEHLYETSKCDSHVRGQIQIALMGETSFKEFVCSQFTSSGM